MATIAVQHSIDLVAALLLANKKNGDDVPLWRSVHQKWCTILQKYSCYSQKYKIALNQSEKSFAARCVTS